MTTTDQDARALAYLARRLRDETPGAISWDEAGTLAIIGGLVGTPLAVAAERVLHHAQDPTAHTPGAIRRPFAPPGPDMHAPPRPPKPDEACDRCGLHATACQCDQPTRRPAQRLDPDTVRARVAVLRHNVVPLRSRSNRPDPTDPQPEEPA